ncbi:MULTISPECIES: glycerate kinase family protein [Streptomyces]|uniref:Glycerate kinase n=1 Tax=Streptomyces microflavus TaxID=1919 RepID=A0ABV1PX73_STRMI|nr:MULTISPECIES: glycerate kinase [Streptomyces]MBK3583498.1 glycerate kinase [Streptomyces sp. MBT57]MBK5991051.1 glycerate kinase [Streptomyces sp. MBT58]OXY85906.1 glycerate kinase [Streptomyces sp. 2R]QQZ56602.1 glycerate kinase [Streptomyces microflavus]QTA34904.1 glycerate kinase [Streptomyces sp. CA-256286]
MTHRIAIAPSGFKESLSAARVAEAIAVGVRRVIPDADLDLIPLVDGGEGTAEALALAGGGRLVPCTATGPVGDPVPSHFALLGGGTTPGPLTAVVEMAAVAGLALVPPGLRHPGATTTYGVGELIRAALDAGARRILIGCGDSGTSDGGAGALQALGARLTDRHGRELRRGGGALHELERIDPSGLDPRLARTELLVACNPYNVLCGKRGVARVFGPQKGATPAEVELLSAGLERWAAVLTRDLLPAVAPEPEKGPEPGSGPALATGVPLDLRTAPGTGASGGLGAGLAAVGARLLPRYDVLLDGLDLDARLARADFVITAEGALDHQTVRGKIPAEVARRAQASGVPVLVLAGTIGPGAQDVRAVGVDAYSAILPAPMTLVEAIGRSGELLADATERALRIMALGSRLGERAGRYAPSA